MLAKMFSGRLNPGTQDEQGAYMLDRNPKYFEPILDYLRTRELIVDPNVSMDGILAEARFFGIQSLMDQIEKANEKDEKHQNIEFQLKDIAKNIDAIAGIQAGIIRGSSDVVKSAHNLKGIVNQGIIENGFGEQTFGFPWNKP